MNFSAQELLLANAVRELAIKLRGQALSKAIDSNFGQYRAGQPAASNEKHNSRLDFEEQWKDNNGIEAFVEPALVELEKVATAIKNSVQ